MYPGLGYVLVEAGRPRGDHLARGRLQRRAAPSAVPEGPLMALVDPLKRFFPPDKSIALDAPGRFVRRPADCTSRELTAAPYGTASAPKNPA
jgi:hypothetical protein